MARASTLIGAVVASLTLLAVPALAAQDSVPVTSLAAIASGGDSIAGRPVRLHEARVAAVLPNGSFVVAAGSTRVLVVPAVPPAGPLTVGNALDIEGTVMRMSPQVAAGAQGVNTSVYIYALGARQ